MVEIIIGGYPVRAFGRPDEPWLIDAGDFDGAPDGVIEALHSYGAPLVLDLRLDTHPEDQLQDIPVVRNPVGHTPDSPIATVPELFGLLVLAQGHQLTSAVVAIAEADGPVLLRSGTGEQTAALVVALTLLAAGAPVHTVVEDFSSARNAAPAGTDSDPASGIHHALWVLDRFNGVECYLLRHGMTIEHFYSLRQKHQDLYDEP